MNLFCQCSRDSSVVIATRYGLEGPGIESRWGEIFRTYPDRLWGPPSLLYNGYRVFPGGKDGRGVMLTTHPLLVPRLRKSWAIPPFTLRVLLGLLRGSFFLFFQYKYFVRFMKQAGGGGGVMKMLLSVRWLTSCAPPSSSFIIFACCSVRWSVAKYQG
jgi:hypothetical protein